MTCAHAHQVRHISACDDGADPRPRRSRLMLADRYRAKSEEIVDRSSDRAGPHPSRVHGRPRSRTPACRERAHDLPGGPIREGDARGRPPCDVPALDRRASHGAPCRLGAGPVIAGRPRRSSVVRPLACPHRSRPTWPIAGPSGTQAGRRAASGSASGPSWGRRPPRSSVDEAEPTPEDRIVVPGCAGNLGLPHASSIECSVPFPSAAPPGRWDLAKGCRPAPEGVHDGGGRSKQDTPRRRTSACQQGP